MFALPWYLTWFGHSLNQYRDVVRLYDFFLATPPLMPLYVAAALVIHRCDEIFEVGCDMASIHCLLSQIPDDLPFENILKHAMKLYKKYPPNKVEKDVVERIRREYVYTNFINLFRKLTGLVGYLKRLFSFHFYHSIFSYDIKSKKRKVAWLHCTRLYVIASLYVRVSLSIRLQMCYYLLVLCNFTNCTICFLFLIIDINKIIDMSFSVFRLLIIILPLNMSIVYIFHALNRVFSVLKQP